MLRTRGQIVYLKVGKVWEVLTIARTSDRAKEIVNERENRGVNKHRRHRWIENVVMPSRNISTNR